MKKITATEAARQFSDVLDAVENRHESFVVTRGGKEVARIAPVPAGSGAAIKEVWRRFPPDEEWETDLADLRSYLVEQDRDWPD